MRLNFYSGLAVTLIAAETARAASTYDADLDDTNNYNLSQMGGKDLAAGDDDAKGWSLAQSLSDVDVPSTMETNSEADNSLQANSDVESDAFVTTDSEVEGGNES